MTDKRYNIYEIKSLIVNDKSEDGEEGTWAMVCYDSVKSKTMEKELRRQLKEMKEKK